MTEPISVKFFSYERMRRLKKGSRKLQYLYCGEVDKKERHKASFNGEEIPRLRLIKTKQAYNNDRMKLHAIPIIGIKHRLTARKCQILVQRGG